MYGLRSSAPPEQLDGWLASHKAHRGRQLADSLQRWTALTLAAIRELTWALGLVGTELDGWERRARLISDPQRRRDALTVFSNKRASIEGASLFCTIPVRRNARLLALLVACEIIADYLDEIDEHRSEGQVERGRKLQAALIEAVDLENRLVGSRQSSSLVSDDGYLERLVDFCRTTFSSLPSSRIAAPYVRRAAELTRVLSINHEPDERRRDDLLAGWAHQRRDEEPGLFWFESPAAASAWLPLLVLLALASEGDVAPERFEAAYHAYHPWVSLLGTMLDSYGDMQADLAAGRHSYAARYGGTEEIGRRLSVVIRRAIREAQRLREGARHEVIVASMTAMYLSSDGARAPDNAETTRALLRSAGGLTRLVALMVRARGMRQQRNSFPLPTPDEETRRVLSGRRRRENDALPDGPRLPAVAQTLLSWRFPLWYFDRMHERHGNTFTMRLLGQPPFVFFSKRDDIAALFKVAPHAVHPGQGANVLVPIIGEHSFMLLDEPLHMHERKTVLRAFRGALDDADPDLIDRIGQRHLQKWPVDTPVALEPLLRSLALEIVLAGLFGAEAKEIAVMHSGISKMFVSTPTLLLQEPFLRVLPIGRASWRAFCARRTHADDLIYSYLNERRDAHDGIENGVDALLRSNAAGGSPMSLDCVRDHLMTLSLSGHETTAAELAWAILLLAHNPRASERLGAEIDEETSSEYMDATIRETLRHRPVFPFTMPRHAQEPIVIEGRTYTPPASLLGCIYLSHHDPECYPQPQRFLPERFLGRPPQPHAWLPWGGGHRRCPGHLFATTEMPILLRAILTRFTILPIAREVEPARWRGVIIAPGWGARVVLRRRR